MVIANNAIRLREIQRRIIEDQQDNLFLTRLFGFDLEVWGLCKLVCIFEIVCIVVRKWWIVC